MSKKAKLTKRLISLPKDFTFDEAKSLLVSYGYVMSNVGKTSGSRVCFTKNGFSLRLHKPHPENTLKTYQIIEIINELKGAGLI